MEEDETPKPLQPIMRTANSYLSTIRSQARATASGRKPRGRPANILRWLGDRALPESDLLPLGRELNLQRALLRFSNPVRQYLRGIPRRYRAFRQIRREEMRWYQPERAGNHVNGLEVDLMLLASLRLTSSMMQDNQRRSLTDNPGLAVLDRTSGIQRNQILVDEATDFSPVQLACMAALANPEANSFFACGDFNQRITSWGASNVNQLEWVYPDIELKEIAIAYRQTRQLLDFARAVAEATGEQPVLAKLPEDVDNEGVAPVLATGISEEAEIVQWLAGRIVEIETTVSPRPLPTIAILVNGEHQVRPIADALDKKLEAHNLRAVACTDGRIIGQANEIRVFDVQHIKGLEFEAVFFLGIDVLASNHPLFARFLYVGATRAATYLGITCEEALPKEIASLEHLFIENW